MYTLEVPFHIPNVTVLGELGLHPVWVLTRANAVKHWIRISPDHYLKFNRGFIIIVKMFQKLYISYPNFKS